MSTWTQTRSEIARTIKANPGADVTELRRRLKAEKLEEYIRQTVNAAPPLTRLQREHLATVLRNRASEAGGAA